MPGPGCAGVHPSRRKSLSTEEAVDAAWACLEAQGFGGAEAAERGDK